MGPFYLQGKDLTNAFVMGNISPIGIRSILGCGQAIVVRLPEYRLPIRAIGRDYSATAFQAELQSRLAARVLEPFPLLAIHFRRCFVFIPNL